MRHVDDGRDTGSQLDLQRGDVQRVAHHHLQWQRAVEAPVVVQRNVLGVTAHVAGPIAPRGENHRGVEDRAHHVDLAALDGGGVGEDLEARTGWAGHVVGEVELPAGPVVIVAADHGQHLARLRVHADEGRVVEIVEVPLLRDLFVHDLFRLVLEVQVKAGVDPVASLIVGPDVMFPGQRL